MDDNKFDDIIKGKLAEFEDSSFDPSALPGFHNRMAAQITLPWHVRYGRELTAAIAGGIVVILSLLGQWYFIARQTQQLQAQISQLQLQNGQLGNLLQAMSNPKNQKIDTIQVIEYRESNPLLYARLEQQMADLKKVINDSSRSMVSLSNQDNNILTALVYNQAVLRKLLDKPFQLYPIKFLSLNKSDSLPMIQMIEEPKKLSAKDIIKKENYTKGVGLRIGPTVEVSQGYYKAGYGEMNIGFGILGDIILSPMLSFETGLKYTHWFYSVKENELHKINLESANLNIGTVKQAEIDSKILEVPLNIKYRVPITRKLSFLTRFGYSTMVYSGQTIEYSYEYDPVSGLFLKDSHKLTGFRLSPGALNISFGVSKQLKNKNIAETGLFYQYSLGKMGVEENKMAFLGLRGVYWFPLR